MRTRRRALTSLLTTPAAVAALAFTLVLTGGGAAHAGTNNSLAITHYQQNKSQWCWVTGPQVAIRYLKGSVSTQCTLWNYGKGTTTCSNEGGTAAQIEKVVDHYLGAGGNWTSGALSLGQLQSSIDYSHPILSWIDWKSGGAHLVTSYAYFYAGAWNVSYSNADGAVGTGTNAARASRTLDSFANNASFSNARNMTVSN